MPSSSVQSAARFDLVRRMDRLHRYITSQIRPPGFRLRLHPKLLSVTPFALPSVAPRAFLPPLTLCQLSFPRYRYPYVTNSHIYRSIYSTVTYIENRERYMLSRETREIFCKNAASSNHPSPPLPPRPCFLFLAKHPSHIPLPCGLVTAATYPRFHSVSYSVLLKARFIGFWMESS